jgi:hypothetical protein
MSFLRSGLLTRNDAVRQSLSTGKRLEARLGHG